jgi:hypothetical protein
MPSRLSIFAIVAFWLAATSWLIHRDLWPRLRTGEPPPITIDLADEASRGNSIRWTMYRDGHRAGYAKNGTEYNQTDDTFTLLSEFKLWYHRDLKGTADRIIVSHCQVTREGQLKGFAAYVTLTFGEQEVKGSLIGQIEDQRLSGRVHVKTSAGDFDQAIEPIPVSSRGSMLNPTQPVNRIVGLRRGQHWRMPLIDPVVECGLDVLQKKLTEWGLGMLARRPAVPTFLDAEVLAETKDLEWHSNERPVRCLVIEYSGEDTSGRTWVRASDGLVLRQEMKRHGDEIVLQRD